MYFKFVLTSRSVVHEVSKKFDSENDTKCGFESRLLQNHFYREKAMLWLLLIKIIIC